MPRAKSRAAGLLGALLLLGAGSFGYLAWISRAPVRDLLPSGAVAVAEVRDAKDTVHRLEGTAFAREFARSRTGIWLEQTALVKTLDGLRAEVQRAAGIDLQRRHLLDLVGREAVVAWYPGANGDGRPDLPWLAGCRLSLRAWCLAAAWRIVDRLGFGAAPVRREESAGREILCFAGADPGSQYHAFFVGRILVVGSDRDLVARAARCAAGDELPVTRDPAWAAVRSHLPPEGGLFLWATGAVLPAALMPEGKQLPPAAGILVRPGRETEIHLFTAHPGKRAVPAPATTAAAPFPGIALLSLDPLFFHSRRGTPPPLVGELLATRALAVARRDGGTGGAIPPLGDGFGLIVTESAGEGPFPRPRGVVLVGMSSPAAAGEALRLLFPRGSRSTDVRGMQAFSTLESLPLAGSFELWGAAADRYLVFATDTRAMEALRTGSGAAPLPARVPDPATALGGEGRVEAISALSMVKTLPLLRRYAPPLSGLLRARYPEAPDLAKDVELLGAIRSITVYAGSVPAGTLTRIRLSLGDR